MPSSVLSSTAPAQASTHDALLRFIKKPVADTQEFAGRRVAIVATDGVSTFELESIRDYLLARGANVDIVTPRPVTVAHLIGMAAQARPQASVATVDYAGEKTLVAVSRYVDQVRPQDYDAVYLPDNRDDMQRLHTNSDTIALLLAAQRIALPTFVIGNAATVMPASAQPVAGNVYAAKGALDMPQMIDAMAATFQSPTN
jgi:putative intracellular protease/amidase